MFPATFLFSFAMHTFISSSPVITMLQSFFTTALVAATTVCGCADHSFDYIEARSQGLHARAEVSTQWTYDASYNWGKISTSM